ncbi:condensation domain-containing protein, partial [Streptomyces sp. NPDC045369]
MNAPDPRNDRIAALPAHLQEQLRRRLAGGARKAAEIPAVPRDGAPLPLSAAQRRLWLLDELEPGSTEYNSAAGLRLTGPLDIAALTGALNDLVARHEALRTTFDRVDDDPVQTVRAPYDVPLPLIDLVEQAGADAAPGLLDAVARAQVDQPFDLRTGPLFRPALVRVAPDEHVLLLCAHHIVTDGWSTGVLLEELGTLYAARRSGSTATLPEPALQYADFASWQRNRMTPEWLAEHLGYWRGQLAGLTPLDLPGDHPRPPVRSGAGAVHDFSLPADVAAGLRELARAQDTTLYTVLVAACQVLFARYAGQRDVAVGTVTSGRNRPELTRMAGFFVNTVVLRSTVDDDAVFTDFLAGVKDTVLDAFANDEVPFDRLVEALRPERDPSRTPLFQTLVVLQSGTERLPELPGLQVAAYQVPRTSANFDLTVEFQDARGGRTADGGLTCSIEYATDLWDAAGIDRMAGHLRTLLAGVAQAPRRPVRDLPWLDDAEHAALLRAAAGADFTVGAATVVQLLDDQAARTPRATALVSGSDTLTYRELDERSNRVARALIARDIGPEHLVAVAASPGTDLVVTLLGVLKTGGAYVPVDPAHPAERIAYVLDDAAPSLVLADSAAYAALPAGTARTLLDGAGVQGLGGDLACGPVRDDERTTPLDPAHPAYVIYTSGSTG